jgi:hypothetical protein
VSVFAKDLSDAKDIVRCAELYTKLKLKGLV